MSQKKRDKRSVGKDPHRSREQAKYEQPIASREFIISLLSNEKGPMDFEALADKLGFGGNADKMEALRRRVGAMFRDGQLIQNRKRGLVPVDTETLLAGRISAHPDGFGFVNADDGEKDIYLSGKQMRQVLHGDRVVVGITGKDHKGRREGRIVEVVERANKSVVGRLSIDRGTVVVLPDNKRIHQNVLIAQNELADAVDGDMVVVEIVEQPTRRYQPVGKVVEVLGQHLRPGMEIDVALHSHGIPVQWPDEVLDQAGSFSTTVDSSLASERKDVRDLSLITIDGIDARDFDDAVWCERLEKGWRLMVAIADVAHYVSIGSALDREAVERGTSVYFPGRVVPMLPEVLSNGLCSLNPDVDRLCMLCELTLDEKGNVKKTRFHNAIMRSHARLTYDQVSEMLVDDKSPLRSQYANLISMIEELHKLYKVLAKKRRKRGAIEFESNETHIIFDENKKIKEIVPIQRNDAHKLIEECMILANIQAAAYLEEREIPALYRVHAGPKTDRLEDLRAFLALRSLSLGGGDQPSALDYAALAEAITDRPDKGVIQTVMLRSMQQAVYQPKNEGHFGLALDQYAHFTSPIRRYPDLLVHRALKFALTKKKNSDYHYSKDAMVALGESCSITERRAEDASRDVVAWLKCEYMQDHVGGKFPGVVSAVTSFGLFVELVDIHVEGLVHITNLQHDYYRFEQAGHKLVGERTGRQYQLGDPIVVQVAAVNLEDRKIDFTEVEQKFTKNKKGEKKSESRYKKHHKDELNAKAKPAEKKAKSGKAVSKEKRRQDKRRLKQQRRDEKRAAAKEAKRLEVLRSSGNEPVSQSDVSDVQPASPKAGKKITKKISKKTAKKASKKVAKKAAAKVATNAVETASVAKSRSDANNKTKTVKDKIAGQSAKKSSKKASKQSAKKVSKKVTKKVTKKTAKKAIRKVTKKVAKKSTPKVAKKIVKKTARKLDKKSAKKRSGKLSKQEANKVASKKTAKRVTKKIRKKSGNATGKKKSKYAAKKVARSVVNKKSKKPLAKVSKKAVSKVAKRSAANKKRQQ